MTAVDRRVDKEGSGREVVAQEAVGVTPVLEIVLSSEELTALADYKARLIQDRKRLHGIRADLVTTTGVHAQSAASTEIGGIIDSISTIVGGISTPGNKVGIYDPESTLVPRNWERHATIDRIIRENGLTSLCEFPQGGLPELFSVISAANQSRTERLDDLSHKYISGILIVFSTQEPAAIPIS